MSLARTFRTLRPLRPSQLLWRARYAAGRAVNRRRGTSGRRWEWTPEEPPPLRADVPVLPTPEPPGTGGERLVELLERGVVEHLGRRAELGWPRPDWRLGTVDRDRLWTITLHYHGWAFALARTASRGGPLGDRAGALFRELVGAWIRDCRLEEPGSTALAWNSYAVATRLGWWVRAYRVGHHEIFAADHGFERVFLRSLWQQAGWLSDHLEWDLRANHLLRDLAGLAVAGRFFAGDRSARWLAEATRLALAQAAEQFLADGVHFERSPWYHLDAMRDLAVLTRLVERPATAARLADRWAAAADALLWLRHPEGGLAQLNDGSRSTSEAVRAALEEGRRLGREVDLAPRTGGRHFASAGLVVWHGEPWSVFFDVGEVGPDVQPGHAHADTLTVECSFRGRRLVVDPGTFAYDDDSRRAAERATASHNTVAVDGESSSEVWGVFRVGRRARPVAVEVDLRDGGLAASAAHDGYRHLEGSPCHHRRLEVADGGDLVIVDRVEGRGEHDVDDGLLVAAGWEVAAGPRGWRLRRGGDEVSVTVEGPVETYDEARFYSPSYGVEERGTRIGWRRRGALPLEARIVLEEAR